MPFAFICGYWSVIYFDPLGLHNVRIIPGVTKLVDHENGTILATLLIHSTYSSYLKALVSI